MQQLAERCVSACGLRQEGGAAAEFDLALSTVLGACCEADAQRAVQACSLFCSDWFMAHVPALLAAHPAGDTGQRAQRTARRSVGLGRQLCASAAPPARAQGRCWARPCRTWGARRPSSTRSSTRQRWRRTPPPGRCGDRQPHAAQPRWDGTAQPAGRPARHGEVHGRGVSSVGLGLWQLSHSSAPGPWLALQVAAAYLAWCPSYGAACLAALVRSLRYDAADATTASQAAAAAAAHGLDAVAQGNTCSGACTPAALCAHATPQCTSAAP